MFPNARNWKPDFASLTSFERILGASLVCRLQFIFCSSTRSIHFTNMWNLSHKKALGQNYLRKLQLRLTETKAPIPIVDRKFVWTAYYTNTAFWYFKAVFIIFRHIYNMGGKSSSQSEHFLPDFANFKNVYSRFSPNSTFAVECDWNSKISQNLQSLFFSVLKK